MTTNKASPLSRREFLITLTAACASLLSPAVLAGNFSAIGRRAGGPLRTGAILSLAQMKTLGALVDVIIPRTDTASASEVDTHGVIDDQLAKCESREAARDFIQNLNQVSELSFSSQGSAFEDLDEKKQHALMLALANGASPFEKVSDSFFSQLKSLTVMSYYTSEEGGSKDLVYDPIPGGYNGHFKVSDNQGKAFSIFHY